MDECTGRQQAVLVAVCCLLDGAGLLAAWLWRPNLAWDHPLGLLLAINVIGVGLVSAVADRPFWRRLGQPRQPHCRHRDVRLQTLDLHHTERARRAIRNVVLRAVGWRIAVVVASIGVAVVAFLDLSFVGLAEHDQQVVRDQPHLVARVVEVTEDKWQRFPSYTVDVALPDGRRVELVNGDGLDPLPRVGTPSTWFLIRPTLTGCSRPPRLRALTGSTTCSTSVSLLRWPAPAATSDALVTPPRYLQT